MPRIPEHLLITTYDGARGGHLLAYHDGAAQHLCPASRDDKNQIRHFWWAHELDDPDAPAVDCPDCAEVLGSLRGQ